MFTLSSQKSKLLLLTAIFLLGAVFTITSRVDAATEGLWLEYIAGKTFPADNKTGVKEVQMNPTGDVYSAPVGGLTAEGDYSYKIKVISTDGKETYYPATGAYSFKTIAKTVGGGGPDTGGGNTGGGGNGGGDTGGNVGGNNGGTFPVVANFVGKVDRLIINPLIVLMFAAALGYFLLGMLQFIMNAGNAEERATGRSHMLWGLTGMLVMFGVFVILRIVMKTIGASNANIPTSMLLHFFA